ncbi:hypothetical protein EAG_07402 [Camponotus floridanus]|uniref:Uncharacterized protein n=1 Tax=Camponotus floridanus TaxID=104421 RepID=E2ASF8_CAMFO|nr:hypothetical protein EAG_07402 [Camponotus floridanus]
MFVRDYGKTQKLRSRAQPHVSGSPAPMITTRLLTTTLGIQEKLVTSKLRPSLAIAVDSAISEARRKSHRSPECARPPNCPP